MRILSSWMVVPVVAISLAASRVTLAQAPRTQKIDDKHLCRSCELRIDKIVRLSDPRSGMGSSSNLTSIDRDSRGRYWVADYGSKSSVLVFGPDGKLIRRIGREGSGPGEFRNVTYLLVGPGDTVHAFDESLRRRSEISATTLEVLGQHAMPETFFSMTILPNGNFVGVSSVADVTGHPFEEVDRKGNRVRSFGGDGKTAPSWTRPWATDRIVPDLRGGFYALSRRNYFIEHWDVKGSLTAKWDRAASWFPEWPLIRVNPPLNGRSNIFAAWVNADGLLFVGSHVRQDGWEKAMGEVRGEGGRTFQGVEDYDRYYDSIIEVIDPKTSRVIASVRHDLSFTWSAANGEIYIRGDDPEEFIDIYRVTFVRR